MSSTSSLLSLLRRVAADPSNAEELSLSLAALRSLLDGDESGERLFADVSVCESVCEGEREGVLTVDAFRREISSASLQHVLQKSLCAALSLSVSVSERVGVSEGVSVYESNTHKESAQRVRANAAAMLSLLTRYCRPHRERVDASLSHTHTHTHSHTPSDTLTHTHTLHFVTSVAECVSAESERCETLLDVLVELLLRESEPHTLTHTEFTEHTHTEDLTNILLETLRALSVSVSVCDALSESQRENLLTRLWALVTHTPSTLSQHKTLTLAQAERKKLAAASLYNLLSVSVRVREKDTQHALTGRLWTQEDLRGMCDETKRCVACVMSVRAEASQSQGADAGSACVSGDVFRAVTEELRVLIALIGLLSTHTHTDAQHTAESVVSVCAQEEVYEEIVLTMLGFLALSNKRIKSTAPLTQTETKTNTQAHTQTWSFTTRESEARMLEMCCQTITQCAAHSVRAHARLTGAGALIALGMLLSNHFDTPTLALSLCTSVCALLQSHTHTQAQTDTPAERGRDEKLTEALVLVLAKNMHLVELSRTALSALFSLYAHTQANTQESGVVDIVLSLCERYSLYLAKRERGEDDSSELATDMFGVKPKEVVDKEVLAIQHNALSLLYLLAMDSAQNRAHLLSAGTLSIISKLLSVRSVRERDVCVLEATALLCALLVREKRERGREREREEVLEEELVRELVDTLCVCLESSLPHLTPIEPRTQEHTLNEAKREIWENALCALRCLSERERQRFVPLLAARKSVLSALAHTLSLAHTQSPVVSSAALCNACMLLGNLVKRERDWATRERLRALCVEDTLRERVREREPVSHKQPVAAEHAWELKLLRFAQTQMAKENVYVVSERGERQRQRRQLALNVLSAVLAVLCGLWLWARRA